MSLKAGVYPTRVGIIQRCHMAFYAKASLSHACGSESDAALKIFNREAFFHASGNESVSTSADIEKIMSVPHEWE